MSLAVWIFLLCIGWPLAYALWSFLRAAWGPRRNRRVKRWPNGKAHGSFWADSAKRGGIECSGRVEQ